MRKEKKIYSTPGKNYVQLEMQLGGIKTMIEFKNGRVMNNIDAQFITSNKFLQEMIEKDPRFGSVIILKQVIDLGDDGQEEKAEEPAPEPAKKPSKGKASGKTVVDEVRDITDAVNYLNENYGRTVSTIQQVKKAASELGLEFPNLH